MKIIAKTFQGLEEVLADEVRQIGAAEVCVGNRMVSFTGDQAVLYRANICLRTAVRVLKVIEEFKASDADQVYERVKQMPWEELMSEHDTFIVDAVCFSEDFRHSKFVAYRTKDAIADRFRSLTGQRPNVSISDPTLRVHVHISNHDVSIALDSSGESLHKRGYRTGTVAAPINEVLAAGIVLLSGWKGECDFIDPFCGSGTILIEAALIARNINPGLFRKEFAFEKWRDFDRDLFDKLYNDDSAERPFDHHIYGFDINRQAIRIATQNVQSAGVGDVVSVQQRDFREGGLLLPESGNEEEGRRKAIMITNPPYGERITTDDILALYSTIGTKLKQQFAGGDAWIISLHEECFDAIGMRPSTKFALYNGALPCELRKYQVFSGSLRDHRAEGHDIKSAEERIRNRKYKPHHLEDETRGGSDARKRGGSRDDEHYFLSRPATSDKRSGGRGFKGNPTHKPSFAGDDEPELNRYNFKWGDRGAGYRRDTGDQPYPRTWEKKEPPKDNPEA